jgi:predicted short-subunit dehydrogenase-like oxidoreductase (DUF2520 family)
MGQVPKYGIVGDGRVAKHICRYFSLEHIPFKSWSRKSSLSLEESLLDTDTILLLVSDSAIENVITEHSCLNKLKLVHFSGSHVSKRAWGVHPLMSFSEKIYDLETYRRIPFIVEEGKVFKDYFPNLINPFYSIKVKNKSLYHAMCVLSGNFTSILWNKFFETLESQFQIPRHVAFLYLEKIVSNLKELGPGAVTGPLIRRDLTTVSNNLKALQNDPFKKVYRAFADIYIPGEKL